MAAVLERLAGFVPPAGGASALKPRPPYFFGMIMPRKPLSLMYCQTCCGRSCSSCVICQSSHIAQSSSTGPARCRDAALAHALGALRGDLVACVCATLTEQRP